MNLFVLTSIACGVFCTILAFITLIFGRAKIHRILAFFNISVAIWGYGCFWAGRAISEPIALLGWRFGQAGGIFIATFFYHLVCIFCGLQRKIQLIAVYIWSMFFLYFCFSTNLLFAKTRLVYNIPYYNDATWLYAGLVFSWLFVVCVSFFELLRFFPKTKGAKRIQTLYIIFGFLTGFVGGASTLIPMFRIPIYPFGNITIPVYCLIATYAILRHHLMDVDVVIKKTVVFATLLTITFGIFVGITFLIQQVIMGGRLLGAAISCSIIILAYRPIEKFLIAITNKYLFQKKYDFYSQIIKPFIDDVATVLDIDEIVTRTIDLLEKLHPKYSDILLLNSDRYISHGAKDESTVRVIGKDSPIPECLKSIKDILSIEDENDKKISEEIKNEMRGLKASLAVPLLIRDELIGIILLGKKKSDEYYTQKELTMLMDLARTEAIAIKNAQLTKEIAERSEKKGIDKTSVGAAHQMKNILARLAASAKFVSTAIKITKSKEITFEKAQSLLATTEDSMQGILKEAEKGKRMLDAILYPAKVKEDFAELNVYAIVKQALEQSSRTKSKDVLERNIPAPIVTNGVSESLPHIIGNESLVEQILENLINNAFDAILWRYSYLKPDGTYRGKITITAKDKGGNIAITIDDNGIGMKDDVKEKLFAGYFTTKSAERKGDGAGLYSMKDWIEQHKGKISFSSEYGKGTTFTVELPKEQEGFNGSKATNP
jgi:signal transduction histidine kinase